MEGDGTVANTLCVQSVICCAIQATHQQASGRRAIHVDWYHLMLGSMRGDGDALTRTAIFFSAATPPLLLFFSSH